MTQSDQHPDQNRTLYRTLQSDRPDLFRDAVDSPIAILTDDRAVMRAQNEETNRRRRLVRSFPDNRIGVLACDPYLGMLVRDAVRFADGSHGIYNRHIGEPGCLVMPFFGGSIVLIRIFRHALRDWTWEFPGGRIAPDDEPSVTARQELEEEIGAVDPVVSPLGRIHPYPAFSSACIYLFTANLDKIGQPQTAEGISSIETVSPARLLQMVNDGAITDAAAIACIFKARQRELI